MNDIYIVEWYDQEGDRHERAFDNKADAELGAAKMEESFDSVAVIWETEIN